jgi:hypothetical protein
MGRNLTLIVPEAAQTDQTIRQYYRCLLQKAEQYTHPEIDYSRHLESGRERALERYDTEDRFKLQMNMPREFRHSSAYERLRALSETDERDYQLRLVEGEELKQMISIFREIKSDVKEAQRRGELPRDSYTSDHWEVEIELGQIAMCEFALEHGYGVKLTH